MTKLVPRRGGVRIAIVLLGIIVGQTILFGPALIGEKILLPLDVLSIGNIYLPHTPAVRAMIPHDHTLADLVLQYEPQRRFAAEEVRAGRWPMWAPFGYCGAPFIWPKYSPFNLLGMTTPSPLILPWVQMLEAIVAGTGAYFFCRSALKLSFWPAAIVAWCFPLTGFLVFWQGFANCGAVYWLGWMLLAVDRAIRNPRASSLVALSIVTALVLVSGNIDVAAQVLIASGLFAIWCYIDAHDRMPIKPVLVVALGWLIGMMLASPHVLPLIEYARTGARLAQREAGTEERPPVGLVSLPLIVLPDFDGTLHYPGVTLTTRSQPEGAAATYCGIFATLYLAPLAFFSKRHRSFLVFTIFAGIFGLSWVLNLPGFTDLLRLNVLHLLSNNRLTFITSFVILCDAAIGLDALLRGEVQFRAGYLIALALFVGLCGWCVSRAMHLPEPVASDLARQIAAGSKPNWLRSAADVPIVQRWFVQSYSISAAMCALGAALWIALWISRSRQWWLVIVMAILLPADLLWFAHDRRVLCDASLYYPRISALEQIARAEPGRMVGCNCFPPDLAAIYGLQDVRGYDAIDPLAMVQLLDRVAVPTSMKMRYARLQNFSPLREVLLPDQMIPRPVLSMLGVRYFVFRGTPGDGAVPPFQGDDYFVMENRGALPRVFVPKHVETIADDRARLDAVTSALFDPRGVAYVASPLDLPGSCRGDAELVSETPTRITASLDMRTAGMVVLSDLWDAGWRAYLDGKAVPIVRVNFAVRGVVARAGKSTLVFRYLPETFVIGVILAGLAVALLIAWAIVERIVGRRDRRS